MSEEDYFKYYIQGSDHYLIPRDIFEELFNEMNNWKNEHKRREKKWEKWATEKGILSSKMGEYLCKYQNIKREYANQNKFLCEYKKENQKLKEQVKELKHIMYVVRDDNGLNYLWCKDIILDWLESDSK